MPVDVREDAVGPYEQGKIRHSSTGTWHAATMPPDVRYHHYVPNVLRTRAGNLKTEQLNQHFEGSIATAVDRRKVN